MHSIQGYYFLHSELQANLVNPNTSSPNFSDTELQDNNPCTVQSRETVKLGSRPTNRGYVQQEVQEDSTSVGNNDWAAFNEMLLPTASSLITMGTVLHLSEDPFKTIQGMMKIIQGMMNDQGLQDNNSAFSVKKPNQILVQAG
ncbi:UNVERIFIED_CONTAM: hypothetical protein K2H54_059314 [Gekko kuhli]